MQAPSEAGDYSREVLAKATKDLQTVTHKYKTAKKSLEELRGDKVRAPPPPPATAAAAATTTSVAAASRQPPAVRCLLNPSLSNPTGSAGGGHGRVAGGE